MKVVEVHSTCRALRISFGLMLLFPVLSLITSAVGRAAIHLILPTGNTAIFDGDEGDFYQHTATSRDDPWKGGMYGYVRNPRHTTSGVVFTRFHEGVDIKPLYRDSRGRPLDSVVAIDQGRVVHVNAVAGYSNYGKYIVVEHIWDGSPYYSLYAHLSEVWVDSGQVVRQGELLGRLGYTGVGINRGRAHLHFEIGLMLNENFQQWYEPLYPKEPNHNGIYSGQNLAGLNVVRLYRALQDQSDLTIPAFMSTEEVFFRVRIPAEEHIDLLRRYPWLQSVTADSTQPHRSWEVSCTRAGLPLMVVSSAEEVLEPLAMREAEITVPCRFIHGSQVCELTGWGEQFVELLTVTSGQIAKH